MRRHELTDAQWDLIKDHLPGKRSDPGRTAVDNRRFVDGVLWLARTGAPGAICRSVMARGTRHSNGTAAGRSGESGSEFSKQSVARSTWSICCWTRPRCELISMRQAQKGARQ